MGDSKLVKWKSNEDSTPKVNNRGLSKPLILKTDGSKKYVIGYYSAYLGYLDENNKPVRLVAGYSELN